MFHPTCKRALIVGIGNVLRDEYHRVSDAIVWSIPERHLVPLRDAVVHFDATLGEDQAGGGIWALGVDLEMAISSSVMSAATSANSGVLR
jgi:hypothetical protein